MHISILKERIASFADEAMRLRYRAHVQKGLSDEAAEHARLLVAGFKPVQIRRILNQARRCAKGAKPPSVEDMMGRIAQHGAEAEVLTHYRKYVLRPLARIHLLAYGFLRNKPYSETEHEGAYAVPNWEAIENVASMYAGQPEGVVRQRFAEWVESAKADFARLRKSPGPQNVHG